MQEGEKLLTDELLQSYAASMKDRLDSLIKNRGRVINY